MFTLVIVIHILVSIVLVASVLLQAGKGASIGATFGGASSQTLFGSAGPTTFFGKLTAVCAALFMLTSLYLTYTSTQQESVMRDVPVVKEPSKEAPMEPPAELPAQGAAAPAEPEATADTTGEKPSGGNTTDGTEAPKSP